MNLAGTVVVTLEPLSRLASRTVIIFFESRTVAAKTRGSYSGHVLDLVCRHMRGVCFLAPLRHLHAVFDGFAVLAIFI